MLTLSLVSRLLLAWQKHAARVRSERQLGALPLEIQKDIGWPPHAYEIGRADRTLPRPSVTRRAAPRTKNAGRTRALC